MNERQFILASGSPRRRQLLEEAGWRFRVVVPPLAEPEQGAAAALSPAALAEALAYYKAKSVFDAVRTNVVVLGADTIVALGSTVFGKPADRADARRILLALGETRHEVITGVAVLVPDGQRFIASDTTFVTMRKLSDPELEGYLDSGQWEGKAGAYGIQDADDPFVQRFEGSFTNVVGLPMEMVQRLLEKAFTCPSLPEGDRF